MRKRGIGYSLNQQQENLNRDLDVMTEVALAGRSALKTQWGGLFDVCSKAGRLERIPYLSSTLLKMFRPAAQAMGENIARY